MNKRLEEIILEIALEDYESGHTTATDKASFDHILQADFNIEVGDEAFDFYTKCKNMGPVGFYEEYKDELDFSPEFKAEHGFEDEEIIEESLTETIEDVSPFKVQQIDSEGHKLDQFANFNSAEEAIAFAKTLKTPAEVIDTTIEESLKEEKVIWTNLDTLKESISRDSMISELKAKGKNYNFNRFTDAQLYRIYEREINKKIEEPSISKEEDEFIEIKKCPQCNHQLTDSGECPVCDLGDEEERSTHMLYLDESLFNESRVDPKVFEFNIHDRVAERWNDGEFNVGTVIDMKEEEGTQYLVKWDYSDGPDEEWLYGDELTQWIEESITYPNGVEVRKDSVDLDKALDFMYGLDRLPNDEYTEEEQQRAINYWIKKTDPSPYEESLNEEILNEGPFDIFKKKSLAQNMDKTAAKETKAKNKLINNLGKILNIGLTESSKFLVNGKWIDYDEFMRIADPRGMSSFIATGTDLVNADLNDSQKTKLFNLINAVVVDKDGFIVRKGAQPIKAGDLVYFKNRPDLVTIEKGYRAEDLLNMEAPVNASSKEDFTKTVIRKAEDTTSEETAPTTPKEQPIRKDKETPTPEKDNENKEPTEPSKEVTDKTIQNTINAAKVFGMNIYAMQGGDIKELNDVQLKNLRAGINMDKIWVGKDNKTRVTLSELATELKKRNIIESLDDEMEYDNLEEKVITHDSLQDGDMEELLSLAKEIGINTVGELNQFAEREVPQGTSLLDTLKQYRDDLGDDFEIVENFDGSPETLVESYQENDIDVSWFNK